MNFELTTLGHYVKIQGGYAYKSHDFLDESNNKVLKIKNIRAGYVTYDDCAYISDELASKTKAWSVSEGDVLISMTGSGPNAPQSLVGRVARVWNGDAYLNQRVGRVVLKSNFSIHLDFIYYYLSQNSTQEYFVANSTGSANQANISGKTIEDLPFPIVDFEDSYRISKVLLDLDKKILVNFNINQTLEQMAQALFKSWFIDFEPVKAKIAVLEAGGSQADATLAAMAAISGKDAHALAVFEREHPERYAELKTTAELFPSAMQESELGEIPEGWFIKPLDGIATYQNGLALQKFRPENENDYLPVVKIAQLKKGFSDGEEKASPNIKPECIIDNGDVIFSWSGSLMVDIWCGGKAALNQHLFKVSSTKYPKWLYYKYTAHHLIEFQRIAEAKAVTMGHIKREHLSQAKCLMPSSETICAFTPFFEPVLNRVISNRLEARKLENLRDTLLPKLLSGEITLPEAEQIISEEA
ncbi:restriction endonuclease subunit S [Salmonella enterica subsp. enterica]|nr:restriction endonuclease subunit S [Salmonella enterica subsp. enterica]